MKMSDLIEDAVRAVKRRAADPRYKIEMEYYHFQMFSRDDQDKRVPRGPCEVCAAGARFADELLGTTVDIYELEKKERTEAQVINQLRMGAVSIAAEEIGLDSVITQDREVEHYHDSPKDWYQDMETLIQDLRSNDE